MTPKLILYLFFTIVMLHANVDAQIAMNAASKRVHIDNNYFEYAIGEMTLVSTIKNNELIVTQGFYQPINSAITIDTEEHVDLFSTMRDEIRIYPNPTKNLLHLEILNSNVRSYSFELTDAFGRMLQSQKDIVVPTNYSSTLSFLPYAIGVYFIRFVWSDMSNQKHVCSYKIVKE